MAEQELSSMAERSLVARDSSPDAAFARRELLDALVRAVENLPEQLRRPLRLFSEEDKSHAEIARVMRCTVKTVEMRLYHARKRLAARLARGGFESLSQG